MTRPKKTREIKKIFKIFVEGKNTEPEYFGGLKEYIKENTEKKVNTIQINIIQAGNNTELIKKIIKQKDNDKWIKYYAIIDKDNLTKGILDTIKKSCKENNINLIFSNHSFDLRIILHTNMRTKKVNNIGEYIKHLDKILGLKNCSFKDKGVLTNRIPLIIPQVKEAILNANKLKEQHQKEGYQDMIDCKIEPYTNVNELIEDIFNELGVSIK